MTVVAESAPGYVEQYLLFDPSEYIEGIKNIGQLALSELIYEPEELHEVLQLPSRETDSSPRLFEI